MNIPPSTLLAATLLLAACGGGGAGTSGSAVPPGATALTASAAGGTITVSGLPGAAGTSSHARRPAYVSASTQWATLWIDSSSTGYRVPCSGTTTCTIDWTSISGPHTFTVEVDDGVGSTGPGNVLATGSEGVTLQPGTNSLSITLEGVPAQVVYESETIGYNSNVCAEILFTYPNCATVTYAVTDFDGNNIVSPGAFDRGGLAVTASPNPSWIDFVNGLPTSPTASGNDYTLTFECFDNTAVGDVGLVFTTATTGSSQEPSIGQLVEYELNVPNVLNASTWPTYTCDDQQISAAGPASGSLTAQ